MHDLFLVCVMDCVANRAEKFQALDDIQFIVVAITVEWLPFDELHYEVGQTIFSGAAIKQPGDVWMVQSGKYLSLFAEAAQDESVSIPRFTSLIAARLLNSLSAREAVDSAHTAATISRSMRYEPRRSPDHRVFFFDERFEHAQLGVP